MRENEYKEISSLFSIYRQIRVKSSSASNLINISVRLKVDTYRFENRSSTRAARDFGAEL